MPLAHRLNIPSENVFSVELLFDSDGKERFITTIHCYLKDKHCTEFPSV